MAFSHLEPIGSRSERDEQSDYWRAALIAATIANVNRPKGKKPFRVEDFMPVEDKPKTQAELQQQIDAAMAMFGAPEEKGGKTTAQQRPKGE